MNVDDSVAVFSNKYSPAFSERLVMKGMPEEKRLFAADDSS